MVWAFRILLACNALLLTAALFYRSPSEDPTGISMRMGIAVIYAVALGIVILLYRYLRASWARAPLLVVLTLPVLLLFSGFGLFT